MRIVIDISKHLYNSKLMEGCLVDADDDRFGKAIREGTVLPEHHGRLIDADVLKESYLHHYTNEEVYDNHEIIRQIDNAPTIIEAEESEDKK